jgi:xylan 1,4-beta-xylosidase
VNFEGALTWAFEFEGHPYFAGFRSLATNGIDKPVLNVFRMYSKMSGHRIAAESDAAVSLEDMVHRGVRGKPDVAALASLDIGRLCVMVWHYHDDDRTGPDADVSLRLQGLPPSAGTVELTHYRIDEEHSNAFVLWKKMGSPQSPTDQQYSKLESAGGLHTLKNPCELAVNDGAATIEFTLPRAGVSLLVASFSHQ